MIAATHASTTVRQRRAAGIVLLVATLLEVLAMAHHPSVASHAMTDVLRDIGRFARLSSIVHGVLIALLLAVAYGLSESVAWRGPARPMMRAGAIAYGAGVVAMLGAALVSGFVLGDLVALTPHDTPLDLQVDAHLLMLCRAVNQACANCGAVAMSAGLCFWSMDLLRDRGPARWVGVLGLVAAVGPLSLLVAGLLRLDVHGMTLVVVAQAAWNGAIAVLLTRYRAASA